MEEPHPSAKGNLEIEFRKVQGSRKIVGLSAGDYVQYLQTPGELLIECFIRLHARCYRGVEFPEHEHDENEVMRHLADELRERSLEGIFNKLVLINVAAGYYAGIRLKGKLYKF